MQDDQDEERRRGPAEVEAARIHAAGRLEKMDVRDDGVGRSVKVARHTAGEGPLRRQEVLYEPHLVWMSDGRFTIAGFERVLVDGQVVNYAQSWLCTVEAGSG